VETDKPSVSGRDLQIFSVNKILMLLNLRNLLQHVKIFQKQLVILQNIDMLSDRMRME